MSSTRKWEVVTCRMAIFRRRFMGKWEKWGDFGEATMRMTSVEGGRLAALSCFFTWTIRLESTNMVTIRGLEIMKWGHRDPFQRGRRYLKKEMRDSLE